MLKETETELKDILKIEVKTDGESVFDETIKRMNPQIKERWIAALRSGKYEQGWGALNERGKFCCLGVLCDLYVKETEGVDWRDANSELLVPEVDGKRYLLNAGSFLPPAVQEWAGLKHGNDVVFWNADEERHDGLVDMNDNGSNFNEIAEVIDKWL